MSLKKVIFVLLATIAGMTTSAQELIQFDQANPPFMYQKDGAATGLYPSLFSAAFARAGIPVKLTAVPWKRALVDTDTGLAGTGGIYKNAERLEKYDFSEAFYEERVAIFVPAEKAFSFNSMADLRGKSFNVLSGWSYGDDFDEEVKAGRIKTDPGATDDLTNFKKMMSGRNDAVIAIVESGESCVRTLMLEGKVKRLPKLLVTNSVYLAFGKQANKKAVINAFNSAIASMKSDGSFDAIVEKAFAGQ